MIRQFRTFVGRYLREVKCHVQIIKGSGEPSILFFPSITSGAGLRSSKISEQLSKVGFHTLVVPAELTFVQRQRVVSHFRPTVSILQTGRHALNRREFMGEWPYILDLDDADFFDPNLTLPMQKLASGAIGVIAGSRFIADWAKEFQANVEIIWTGTPKINTHCKNPSLRRPIITWAQSNPIAYRSELKFITDVILKVAQSQGSVCLRLYGWRPEFDRDQLGQLNDPRIELQLIEPLEYSKFVESLCDVSVGLSPIIPDSPFSRGKSFGKILAYLDASTPIICSDQADHNLAFSEGGAIVAENDSETWSAHIIRLLNCPDDRDVIAREGYEVFEKYFTLERSSHRTGAFIEETIK